MRSCSCINVIFIIQSLSFHCKIVISMQSEFNDLNIYISIYIYIYI